jgi:hypothetical protein
LRQTSERVVAGKDFNLDVVADRIDELIGHARRNGTVARLAGPATTHPLISEIERNLAPLYEIIQGIESPSDGEKLVDPARRLMKLRDDLVAHLQQQWHYLHL